MSAQHDALRCILSIELDPTRKDALKQLQDEENNLLKHSPQAGIQQPIVHLVDLGMELEIER